MEGFWIGVWVVGVIRDSMYVVFVIAIVIVSVCALFLMLEGESINK